MTIAETKSNSEIANSLSNRMSPGTWLVLIALLSLLAATVLTAYLGWTSEGDADVPASGYVAMAFGVIVSLALGFGLMALIFYSSRKGYDEPPVMVVRRDGDENGD